jgi:uncharacterized protein
MRVTSIHRYPVKSLAGEALVTAALAPGRGLVNDRRYAFVPAAPGAPPPAAGWRPKSRCVALVRYVSPARLAAHYDDASGVLALAAGGREIARGVPENDADRARLEAAAGREVSAEVGSGVALVAAGEGRMLTDVDAPFVSLVNRASVEALAAALGMKLDALRFRANFYFEGAPAWAERGWAGKALALGGARLLTAQPINRCAATEVNPATAERDARVLRALTEDFGHVEMGIYATVETPGTVAVGAPLAVA